MLTTNLRINKQILAMTENNTSQSILSANATNTHAGKDASTRAVDGNNNGAYVL